MLRNSALESAIEPYAQFLHKNQEENGGFQSWSGDAHFSEYKKTTTAFYTSLILSAIRRESQRRPMNRELLHNRPRLRSYDSCRG